MSYHIYPRTNKCCEQSWKLKKLNRGQVNSNIKWKMIIGVKIKMNNLCYKHSGYFFIFLYLLWKTTTPLYWLWQLNPPSFTFVLHICTALLPNHQVCTFYLFFWGLLFALLANNSQLSQVCTLILYCSTSQWLIILKVVKRI